MDILSILQYSFIQKAFIAGSLVAVTCSSLGIFLVLRKMSLIGDGLAHISFGAIALGLFLGIYPLYFALPVVALGSIFILKISEKARVYADASIGIVSAIGIAGGVIIASLSQGFNVDLFGYLFGNILAIRDSETVFSAILSLAVLLVFYFFYWDLFSSTFDPEYAKTTGIRTEFVGILLTILTAVTVVLSIKVVGVMLVSALLILPSVTALQISGNFRNALLLSSLFSVSSVMAGITLSFYLDLPTGATIVMVNALFFAISFLFKKH